MPFLTHRSETQSLGRRKGGGGGGKSSGSSGSTGKSGGSSTSEGGSSSQGGSTSGGKTTGTTGSSGSTGKSTTVPLSGSTVGGKTTATTYSYGGGSIMTIPSGQLFAGRTAGGGIRPEIYGTRTYGSGYPGVVGRGVSGRGFPFWFWPIVWIGPPHGSYLDAPEYGAASNTSRLGGPMAEATFISNSTSSTFHVLSDNSTVYSLITTIDANCSSSLSSSSSTFPQPYNSSAPGAPKPEQAIQYYRASSVVLTLDGYNNSATLSSDTNVADSPLPSGIDMTLLNCLNYTIGQAAPLVSGAGSQWPTGPSSVSLLGMVWLVWWMLSLL